MTARGYGDDRKVSVTGDTMTGPLHFEGTPPFTVAAGVIGGLVTLDGTSAVSVAASGVNDGTLVLLSVQPGAAPAGIPWVSSITPGTGFGVESTSDDDTGVSVCWYLLETA